MTIRKYCLYCASLTITLILLFHFDVKQGYVSAYWCTINFFSGLSSSMNLYVLFSLSNLSFFWPKTQQCSLLLNFLQIQNICFNSWFIFYLYSLSMYCRLLIFKNCYFVLLQTLLYFFCLSVYLSVRLPVDSMDSLSLLKH